MHIYFKKHLFAICRVRIEGEKTMFTKANAIDSAIMQMTY